MFPLFYKYYSHFELGRKSSHAAGLVYSFQKWFKHNPAVTFAVPF